MSLTLIVLLLAAPTASDEFPAHQFSLEAHAPDAQLAFHFGLIQPLMLDGINVAIDLRIGRFIASYSHGHALHLDKTLSQSDRDAGLRLFAPFSTGFGLGWTILDELYVMADFKWHRYEVSVGPELVRYSTFTIGAEVGWRFFVWKGLYVCPVVRFWPNVADTAPEGGVQIAGVTHAPTKQGVEGLFANVLIGWAFDI
jgi:hypothetical protein